MGLGKTIEVLGLILKDKAAEGKRRKGLTLVVSPLSLISQWEREIKTKTQKLKGFVYYGVSFDGDARSYRRGGGVRSCFHLSSAL